jgi:hypothetical protein
MAVLEFSTWNRGPHPIHTPFISYSFQGHFKNYFWKFPIRFVTFVFPPYQHFPKYYTDFIQTWYGTPILNFVQPPWSWFWFILRASLLKVLNIFLYIFLSPLTDYDKTSYMLSVSFNLTDNKLHLSGMYGNGVCWVHVSARCMGKTLTETKYRVRTTYFHFTSCVEDFLGVIADWWVKDFRYISSRAITNSATLCCNGTCEEVAAGITSVWWVNICKKQIWFWITL